MINNDHARIRVPYLNSYVSKGRRYNYFRPPDGPSIRLSEDPRQAAVEAKQLLADNIVPRPALKHPAAGRFGSIIEKLVESAKTRAKTRDLPFDISVEWALDVIKENNYSCAVTKLPLQHGGGKDGRRNPYRPSLDRIDPEKGYTKDNVRIVCLAVNVALSDWGEDILKNISYAIVRRDQ